MVWITMPIDFVSWSRTLVRRLIYPARRARSRRALPSKTTGSTSTSCAAWSGETRAMRKLAPGTAERLSFLFSDRALPDQAFAEVDLPACARCPPEA